MKRFKSIIKYYIILALERAGVNVTDDIDAELDSAMDDLENGFRRIAREEIRAAR